MHAPSARPETRRSLVGPCEIRYIASQGGKVLARRASKTIAAVIELTAPESAVAGPAEIRYNNESTHKVLARVAIAITAP